MTDHDEKLRAAIATFDATENALPDKPQAAYAVVEAARHALAVFEKAHTPASHLEYYDPARQDSIAEHDCVFEEGTWWFGHGMECKHPELHAHTPTDEERSQEDRRKAAHDLRDIGRETDDEREAQIPALIRELRMNQGNGSDWTEDLFSRAADGLEILLRRSEVPEPSADGLGRRHVPSRWEETVTIIESVALDQGSLPRHEAEQIADAILARSECLHWTPEPQGEPSDAQVEAAARALGNLHSLGWSYMPEYDRNWERGDARAALRAAGGVR